MKATKTKAAKSKPTLRQMINEFKREHEAEIDDYVSDWGAQIAEYHMAVDSKRKPVKLTVNGIAALKPAKAVYEQPDGQAPGLRVVVQVTGGKSFAVRYWSKLHQKRCKLTLGKWPDLSLADARRLTADVRSAVANRQDPVAKVRPARAAEPGTGILVETAWKRYQTYRRDVRHRRAQTLHESDRIMHKDVLPEWQGKTLDQISADDVFEIVKAVEERGAPISANRTLACLNAFLNWCVSQRLLRSASPCAGLKPPAPQKPRERFLDQEELVAVWKAAETLGDPISAVVKLLLIFASRRSEVGSMAWSEIDLTKRSWTIPGERTKNHRELVLPLPDMAAGILKSLSIDSDRNKRKSLPRGSDLVFGLTDGLWSSYKRRLDELLPNLKPWTWHDLRRTAVTHMIEGCDAAPHVVEAIVNHQGGHRSGVAGIYNKAQYKPQMKLTLDRWCDYLDRLVNDRTADVIRLRG